MGMFDDIIVPKSYLKSLLTKEQEKLVYSNDYQTKSLENTLNQYKIHRQKLFVNESFDREPPKNRWVKVSYNGAVNFYSSLYDKDKNAWWMEVNFSFVDGVLDKKELIKFEIQETAEEAEEREKAWKKRHAEMDAFQRTFKYKLFDKIRVFLSRVLEWVQQQTRMPDPSSIKVDRQRVAKKREKLSFWKDY
jgi:hypothetical protein